MKLLVTGACGFLGSHLVEEAAKFWPGEVIAVANYHASGSVGWAEGFKGKVRVVRHDIRDTSAIASYKPDIIVNAAARTSVPYSFDAPLDNWEVNASAVARMLYALPSTRFVQISTSEVFNGRHPPYFDHSMICPSTPYGASKAAAEAAVRATGNTVCRVFNLFGPRQSSRTVIPRMLLQAWEIKRGERPHATLHQPHNAQGDAFARAFLFVQDVARLVITRVLDDPASLVQLSSDEPIKIADLWLRVCAAVGINPALVEWTDLPANVTTVSRLYGKSSEGYSPRKLDDAALAETAEWYGANAAKFGELIYD